MTKWSKHRKILNLSQPRDWRKKALLPIRKQLQTSLENNRQKTPPNGFNIDNFSQTVTEWARWEIKRKENEVSHFGKHI